MDQEKDTSRYHENESGDIYDLYNICGGEVRDDGLLDVSKLDKLSEAVRNAFEVAWLRKVWQHTAAGCEECAGVVRSLNFARELMRARAAERAGDAAPAVDAGYVKSY